MTSLQQFWDMMVEEANASEEGKLFRAAGFALRYEGKGRSAWVKPVIDGWSIVINDEELKGHLVEDGGCWMVGAFSDDRNRLVTLDVPAPTSAADALLIAEYLTNHTAGEGRAAMTRSFKPEVIEATIAGTVFRKCVFVGERYLVACHSEADHLAGLQPMSPRVGRTTRIRFPRMGKG